MRGFFRKFRSLAKACSRQINFTRNEHQKQRSIDPKTHLVYGGDLSVPTPTGSVGKVLFHRMLRYDRTHEVLQICVETKKQMTTRTFLEQTVGFAEKLAEEGIKRGDFVLLVGNNNLNMNVALIGILFLAAVPIPLSHKTDLEEFHTILKFIKPTFFGCDRKYLYPFRQALIDVTNFDPTKIFLLDQETDASEEIEGFEDFIKGRGRNFSSFRPTEVENPKTELALAMKALTDGALGRVVGLTHHNLNSVIARFDEIDDGVKFRERVILMVQKLLWMSGIYSLIFTCAFGSKLVVMRKFEEERFFKAVNDYKVTCTFMFSPKWWQIYKHVPVGEYDLSSCTHAYAVDGSLPLVLTKGLKEKLGINLFPCYGITEMTGLVLKPEGPPNGENCVGKLVPQVYAKVVSDRDSHRVGPKEPGELCFKGPIVTPGYLNNKRANQNLFDKEGFLFSGQYGYYDEVGDFFIIDRIIHQIKYKHFKISPKELEGIIKSLELVKDVCVSGISHATDGEYPIAFVVAQKGQKLKEEDIINYVNSKVPDHKKLRGGVVFLSKIPRFRDTGGINRKLFKKILSKYQIRADNDENEAANGFEN